MKLPIPKLFTTGIIFSLAACAAIPTGPSILVLPGPGKNFDAFRADDYQCRQYALAQIGGVSPNQASAAGGVTSAAAGSLAGTEAAGASGYEAQERYDMGYIQCMFASGNRVPVSGTFIDDDMLGGNELSFPTPLPPPEPMLPPPNQ